MGNLHLRQQISLAVPVLLPAMLAFVLALVPASGFAAVAPDTAPPVTTDNAPAGWQNADFTVTLTCNDGDGSGCNFILWSIDGGIWNMVFNATASVPINTEGDHLIEYQSTDNAGNGEALKTVHARLDKTAPITYNDAWPGWQTADFTVNLTCNDGLNNSGCSQTWYRLDGGPWTTGSSVPINTDGDHVIDYFSMDNAGNMETANSVHARLDKNKPVTSHNAPPDWQKHDITIILTCNDGAGSGCLGTSYNVNGDGWLAGNTVLIDVEGIHTIEFRSIDNSGQWEDTKSVQVKLDKTEPLTTNDAPAGWRNSNFTVTLTCDDDGGSGCTTTWYRVDGGSWNIGTAVSIYTEGAHTIEYYTIDMAGNVEATKSIMVWLDKTPPTTTNNAPAGWQNANFSVNLTCNDGTGSDCESTWYQVNGDLWEWGGWTGNSVSINTDGVHTIDYYSKDNAGNVEGTKSVTARLDKAAPVITDVNPTGIIAGGLTFVSANYSDVTSGINTATAAVKVDGVAVAATAGATGILTIVPGLAPGPHTVEVSVTDNAGNTATAVSNFTICQGGEPELNLGLQDVFWASLADFMDRKLSISYAVNNTGGISALNVELTGSSATNGVTLATPVPASVGGIGAGGSGSATLKYNVPDGVTSFTASVTASAEDQCGEAYAYP